MLPSLSPIAYESFLKNLVPGQKDQNLDAMKSGLKGNGGPSVEVFGNNIELIEKIYSANGDPKKAINATKT